ncbi:DUF3147 family protein [Planotetraspora phitsanulokensis]|uniref:DUF3147 family protein n=1 Tax=Planotetraspora phitsanulokensis TaxID=575192 RepID=A0A8J3XIT7_9ACTN|nr:DUF3147 family protein [Planotetraspora phitsanulokensis]GII42485.1 hypothetical protein Pph01_74880 [Planotetraspora phitsanulokensis]
MNATTGGGRDDESNAPDEDDDRIRLVPRELARTRPWDLVVRFAFGAGISTLAGVVSLVAGPAPGGVFLAFPAILLASLTLVARREGPRLAYAEARGSVFGTLGLIGFAVVVAATAVHWPVWAALTAATVIWAVFGLGSYLLSRVVVRGGG